MRFRKEVNEGKRDEVSSGKRERREEELILIYCCFSTKEFTCSDTTLLFNHYCSDR